MKIINQEKYDEMKEGNDAYVTASVEFAERFAELLESKISKLSAEASSEYIIGCIRDNARQCERAADTEGITGFMYNIAIRFLSSTWKYGKELTKWHNGLYGVPNEEDRIVNSSVLIPK